MSGKLALKYMGKNAEAMKAIAQASKDRSLAEFKQVYNTHMGLLIVRVICK